MSSPLPDPVDTPDRVSTTEVGWRRASRLLAICLLALDHLRSHIRWRSDHLAHLRQRRIAHQPRNPEIGQDRPLVRSNHDVGWLDVAVQDRLLA